MAIPSFEELLGQARAISERNANVEDKQRTNTLLAENLAKMFSSPVSPEASYIGAVNPTSGGFTQFQTPVQTGGSLAQMFGRGLGNRFSGVTAPTIPAGSVPITQKEFADKALGNIFKPK